MRDQLRTGAAILALSTSAAPLAASEMATVLVREGGTLPGTSYMVESLGWLSKNHLGGYVVPVTANSKDRLWGSVAGEAPGVLRTAGPQQTFDIHAFISSTGSLVYMGSRPPQYVAAVFQDDLELVRDGDPYPLIPGLTFREMRPLAVTDDGTPYWHGTLNNFHTGVFAGTPVSPLLFYGDVLPGIPFPIEGVGGLRVAHDGSSYIGSANPGPVVIVNGMGAYAYGTLLAVGNPPPPELGYGTFTGFRDGDVNASGDWVIGYEIDYGARQGILKNGVRFDRTTLLLFGPYGVRINAQGDMLAIWREYGPENLPMNAVWLRYGGQETILLRSLDFVDVEGMPNARFYQASWDQSPFARNFELSDRQPDGSVNVWVRAEVDTAGTFYHEAEDDFDAVLSLRYSPTGVAVPEIARSTDNPVRVSPNPFVGQTALSFTLDRDEPVSVTIHDVQGRLVARLHDGSLGRGTHVIRWDGRGASGAARSGVFFYRVLVGDHVYEGKITRRT